jgi:bifunctional non-homologous end joining protein LigD
MLDYALDPCLPRFVSRPPAGPDWIYEIKHDGYRHMVRRAGADMGIRTRREFDWTGRYPWIVESALGLKVSSLVMDGEGVIVGDDGVSIVDKLHSRGYDNDVLLIGFDLLEMNSTDLSKSRPVASQRLVKTTSASSNPVDPTT